PTIAGQDDEYPLSSGQLSFFKFALLACLHIENGSFVLLDEPETHLHPSMISDFITLLDNILERTGSYALIATHSTYFVREVAREQV
ncbi:AAA family ATPase, partial [Streptococcus pyogenes]